MSDENKVITDHEEVQREIEGDEAVDEGDVDVEDIRSTEKPVDDALNLEFSCQIGSYTLRALRDVVVETAVRQIVDGALNEDSLRRKIRDQVTSRINVEISAIVSRLVEEEFDKPFKAGQDEWLNAREYISLCGKKVMQERVDASGNLSDYGEPRLELEVSRALESKFKKEILAAVSEVQSAAYDEVKKAKEAAVSEMKARIATAVKG